MISVEHNNEFGMERIDACGRHNSLFSPFVVVFEEMNRAFQEDALPYGMAAHRTTETLTGTEDTDSVVS